MLNGIGKKCIYQTSFLRFIFSDNPYLLKKPSQFDYYYFQIPLNFYLRQGDRTSVYSLHSNLHGFREWKNTMHLPQEILLPNINRFTPKIKTLLNEFVMNNQNIKLIEDSFSLVNDIPVIINKDIFPAYLYPVQLQSNQYLQTVEDKRDTTIRLVLNKTDSQTLSGVWKKLEI